MSAAEGNRPDVSAGPYRRAVGTAGIALLVVNSMVGAGIFALPAVLHAAVGDFAPWLLLLGGTLMATIVVCFVELTRLTDRSGGPQRFVTDAFGRFPGFQIGWLFYAARVVSQGGNATVMMAYAAVVWPFLSEGWPRALAILIVLGGITIANIVGIKRVIAVLATMSLFKFLPLLVLVGVGLGASRASGPIVLPQFTAVEGVAIATLYAFVGFENATVPAGEARDPKRSMPRALLIGLALVTLLYFAIQWVYSLSPIADRASETPLVELATFLGGQTGGWLIAATVAVSVLANLTAGQTSASRITSSMAEDRLLPRWFGHVSPRFGTPANSIAFFGALAIAFAITGSFVFLAVVSTLARLVAYIASIGSLPRLRRAAGLPLFNAPILLCAPLALTLSLWAAAQSNAGQWRALGLFVIAGTILFIVAHRQKEPS